MAFRTLNKILFTNNNIKTACEKYPLTTRQNNYSIKANHQNISAIGKLQSTKKPNESYKNQINCQKGFIFNIIPEKLRGNGFNSKLKGKILSFQINTNKLQVRTFATKSNNGKKNEKKKLPPCHPIECIICPKQVKPPLTPWPSVCIEKIQVEQFPPDCPPPCPPPPGPVIPLCRPKKTPLPQYQPCPPVIVCPVPPQKNVIEPKELPTMPCGPCPCVEPPIPKDWKLNRLKRRKVLQYQPCPPVRECPPRADLKNVIEMKELPCIKPGLCPCIEYPLRDCPQLRRLKKKYVPPPPLKKCVIDICPPHLQAVVKKQLPVMPCGPCPCVEPPPLTSVPLPRLKKNLVCPPLEPIECFIEECPPRADEMCEYKPEKRELKTLILCEESNAVSIKQYNSDKKKNLIKIKQKK